MTGVLRSGGGAPVEGDVDVLVDGRLAQVLSLPAPGHCVVGAPACADDACRASFCARLPLPRGGSSAFVDVTSGPSVLPDPPPRRVRGRRARLRGSRRAARRLRGSGLPGGRVRRRPARRRGLCPSPSGPFALVLDAVFVDTLAWSGERLVGYDHPGAGFLPGMRFTYHYDDEGRLVRVDVELRQSGQQLPPFHLTYEPDRLIVTRDSAIAPPAS